MGEDTQQDALVGVLVEVIGPRGISWARDAPQHTA